MFSNSATAVIAARGRDGHRRRVRDAGDAVDPGPRVPARRAAAGDRDLGRLRRRRRRARWRDQRLLLQHFWWGSIFLINVVRRDRALVAGYFLIPRSREKIHAPLDPVGALLSIAGLGALVYAIIEAPDKGWLSTPTVGGFAAAIVILGSFVAWELRAAEPMLDLRFFRNPRFTAATTAITLVFFAMFGTYFIIAQYLQFVHGYSPLAAGIRMLPWALAYMASATSRRSWWSASGSAAW